jgi:hypothetical protein
VGLAGCTTFDDSEPPSEDELPDQCPTSLDLDVAWPRDIFTRSVGGFVTRYEAVGEFVRAYEEAYLVEESTETQFHSVGFSVELDQTPNKLADGFHVTVSSAGAGGVSEYLEIQAFEIGSDSTPIDEHGIGLDESAVPDDPEYISIDEIEDQRLQEVLKSAAGSGYGQFTTSPTARYEELIENLPPNASLGSRRRVAYYDVNGTPVLLVIDMLGGNSIDGITVGPVQYYVTEYVIRRTSEENESPQDGTLVECRLPE